MNWVFFNWKRNTVGDKERLEIECRHCNEWHEFDVNESDLEAWKLGKKIQDAFPYISAAQRELMLSGLCEECWEKLMESQEQF